MNLTAVRLLLLRIACSYLALLTTEEGQEIENGFCLKVVTGPSNNPARPDLTFRVGLSPVTVLG